MTGAAQIAVVNVIRVVEDGIQCRERAPSSEPEYHSKTFKYEVGDPVIRSMAATCVGGDKVVDQTDDRPEGLFMSHSAN